MEDDTMLTIFSLEVAAELVVTYNKPSSILGFASF